MCSSSFAICPRLIFFSVALPNANTTNFATKFYNAREKKINFHGPELFHSNSISFCLAATGNFLPNLTGSLHGERVVQEAESCKTSVKQLCENWSRGVQIIDFARHCRGVRVLDEFI
jgi:hypothetical protein